MKRTRNNYKEMAKERHIGTLEGLRIVNTVKLGPNPFEGKEDPVQGFYSQICDSLGIPTKGFHVDRVAVSKNTAEAFNAALIAFLRKKKVRAHRFEYNYRMLHLQFAPRVVDGVEDGVAHIVEVDSEAT